MTKPSFSWLISRPICFLGFGFGSGLVPFMPGTFGTLPALPLVWLMNLTHIPLSIHLIIILLMFLVGIYICDETEKQLGIQDYGGIVWDEIVAMMLVLAFTPNIWSFWLLAFITFRFFDAIKPWPIKWFDRRVHGGFGIMLDDLIAAIFSILVVRLIAEWML